MIEVTELRSAPTINTGDIPALVEGVRVATAAFDAATEAHLEAVKRCEVTEQALQSAVQELRAARHALLLAAAGDEKIRWV